MRMLGIRLGYYTEDPIQAWRIDSLLDFAEGKQMDFVKYLFPALKGKPFDEATVDPWIENTFAVVLPVYEKRLEEHGKRFLAGDMITIVDFKAFQHWIICTDINPASKLPQVAFDKINALVAKFPNTQRWVNTMK